MRRWLIPLVGSLVWGGSTNATVVAPVTLEIEMGSAHVIRAVRARQVAVGNSQVIQATAVSAHEVVLFGKREGITTVDVWGARGARQSYRVVVQAAGLQQRLAQVRAVVADLPGLRVRRSGRHIVVEGERLSSDDRTRLKKLLTQYSDVIDLTNETPWDPMVLLDVMVLELPTTSLQSLGVQWRGDEPIGLQARGVWSIGTANLSADPASTEADNRASGAMAMWRGTLSSQVQALAQSGQALLLAQPQLVARSGSPATFLAGGEVPYAQIDKDGKATTLFKKYGVQLNVTPRVSPQGTIRAAIEVEVSSIDPTVNTPAGPAMRVRKTKTEFNVRSGQTLVLSGFLLHERADSREGLPRGNGIAWGSGVFGVGTERRQRTELAVFVTPILVDADHPDMITRAVAAEALVHGQLGGRARINHAVRAQPTGDGQQWHPAHPALSQWGGRLPTANTRAWHETHALE